MVGVVVEGFQTESLANILVVVYVIDIFRQANQPRSRRSGDQDLIWH
jgi:hypothetical protein